MLHSLPAVLAQTTTHITLLARVSRGQDPSAWREFCDRYEDLIRAFARRRGVRPTDTDDVVQDVLLALTKAMPGFAYDPAKGKFRSYLKTVVLHAISRRSCQTMPATPLPDGSMSGPGDDPEPLWESEWRQYHLRRAMKTIRAEFGSSDIAAFEAYVREGRSADDTAAALGISVDSVYQAKSRILRRLGQLIESQVAEEG